MKKLLIFIFLAIPAFTSAEDTLLDAVTNGYVAIIINYQGDINQPHDKYDHTALMFAAIKGRTDVIKTLIFKKADLNKMDIFGMTALILAVQNGQTSAVKELIESGADINILDNNGNNALMWAAIKEQTDAVKVLIDAKNNVFDNVNAVLILAAGSCQKDAIKEEFNINKQDIIGKTALMRTAYNGSTDIVNMLIKAGADVNIKDNADGDALASAIDKNNTDVINILKNAGAK